MGGFFGIAPIGLESGPAAPGPANPAPVISDGGGSFPRDGEPSTLSSLGTFFKSIGQTVASTYQALNAPGVPVAPSAPGGAPAPGAASAFGGSFGKLLLYAAIAFAAVFIGIRLFERR